MPLDVVFVAVVGSVGGVLLCRNLLCCCHQLTRLCPDPDASSVDTEQGKDQRAVSSSQPRTQLSPNLLEGIPEARSH